MGRIFSISIRAALILTLPALTACESVGVGVGGVFCGGHGGVGVGVSTSTRRPVPPPRAPEPIVQPSAKELGIPPGHLPKPGYARVWYPDTPPGHQPRPARYEELLHSVPPGGWLIVRPYDRPEHVVIHDYSGVPYTTFEKSKGKGKGAKSSKYAGKGKGNKPKNYRHIKSDDPRVAHPAPYPEEPSIQIGVRVYDSNTGVYVGANIPID